MNRANGVGDPVDRTDSLAHLTDVVVRDGGALNDLVWVSAFHSDNFARLEVSKVGPDINSEERVHLWEGADPPRTGLRGPRSIAVAGATEDVIVLNRLEGGLAWLTRDDPGQYLFDAADDSVGMGATREPEYMTTGREFLYSTRFSGNGFVSCSSCHVDGRSDQQAWLLTPEPGLQFPYDLDEVRSGYRSGPGPDLPRAEGAHGHAVLPRLGELRDEPHAHGGTACVHAGRSRTRIQLGVQRSFPLAGRQADLPRLQRGLRRAAGHGVPKRWEPGALRGGHCGRGADGRGDGCLRGVHHVDPLRGRTRCKRSIESTETTRPRVCGASSRNRPSSISAVPAPPATPCPKEATIASFRSLRYRECPRTGTRSASIGDASAARSGGSTGHPAEGGRARGGLLPNPVHRYGPGEIEHPLGRRGSLSTGILGAGGSAIRHAELPATS